MVFTEVRRHHPLSPWTYECLDQHQRRVASEVRGGVDGRLLLSELAPVVTYGRRTDLARDLLVSADEFASAEVALYPCDRGGFATYHGPGQWVAFPVDRLSRLSGDTRAVRRTVDGLCDAAREVAKLFHADAEIRTGAELGVWSESAGGKLAAIGIQIEQGVLLHGVALNVYPTARSFFGIRPCGFDLKPAYLTHEVLETQPFEAVGQRLAQAILSRFWLETAL